MSDETPKVDSIVSSVIHKFEQRAVFGKNKYDSAQYRKKYCDESIVLFVNNMLEHKSLIKLIIFLI